jgi:probable rRNA maturation factor
MNYSWRGKNKPTDVLSFPQWERHELKKLARARRLPSWELGDVVISLDTAKKQAKEHGIAMERELEILLVHGILHLLGYDHEISPVEQRKMEKLERKLLGDLGLIQRS